jgi:multidrug efflux pump subunit AcrB
MENLKWFGIGCFVLAVIVAILIVLVRQFGDQTGLVLIMLMLFMGLGSIIGDALKGAFGNR